jgi:hypothetical protein
MKFLLTELKLRWKETNGEDLIEYTLIKKSKYCNLHQDDCQQGQIGDDCRRYSSQLTHLLVAVPCKRHSSSQFPRTASAVHVMWNQGRSTLAKTAIEIVG